MTDHGVRQHQAPPERPEEITMPVAVHESWLPSDHPLHRPRHGRRQRLSLVCATAFFLVPAIAFVLGVRPQAIENHKLADFPGFSRGLAAFNTGLNAWATDNLPLRDVGVLAEDDISQGVFGELPQQNAPSNGPLGPASGAGSTGTAPQTAGDKRKAYPDVVKGKDGWLFYGYDMGMKCVPVLSLQQVADSVRNFQRIVTESGRKLVIMVPPDKSTILPQYMPDEYAGKQCMTAYVKKFWPKIKSSANILDVRGQLAALEKSDPDPIYFKTDTHWEDLSAIDALKSAAERIQPGVTNTWQVSKVGTMQRSGDLAKLSGGTQTEPWSRYRISPDGKENNIPSDLPDLVKPITVTNAPTQGMITEPTVILGDSFSLTMDRYASNTFTNVTFGHYQDLQGGIPAVRKLIVNAKVVVLEMLERGMATGESQLLLPDSLAALEKELKAHPMR